MSQNEKKTLSKMKMKYQLALIFIYQWLGDFMFDKIVDATTSKKTWEILEKSFHGIDIVKKTRLQSLMGDFEAFKMNDFKSILDLLLKSEDNC